MKNYLYFAININKYDFFWLLYTIRVIIQVCLDNIMRISIIKPKCTMIQRYKIILYNKAALNLLCSRACYFVSYDTFKEIFIEKHDSVERQDDF